MFTRSSIERLYLHIKQTKGITDNHDVLSIRNSIIDNDLKSEDEITNNKFCCLSGTIGLLLIVLILLFVAYYWKLFKTIN